jgi:cell division septal protein FtsQ
VSRPDILLAPSLQFQRAEGKARPRKDGRRTPAKTRQLVLAVGLAAVLFVAFYEIYMFVISWKNLNVKDVLVVCPEETVKTEVVGMIRELRWGNVLLLDLGLVKTRLESDPWVKEARLRKVFPSSVKIEITPRTPAAVLRADADCLIAEDGVALAAAERAAHPELPLFLDQGRFQSGRREKIDLAWECLRGLSAGDRAEVDSLDVSEPLNVVLTFRSCSSRLILGDDLFAQKITFYRAQKDAMANAFGPPDTVDLRIHGRIYFKPAGPKPEPAAGLEPDKERR